MTEAVVVLSMISRRWDFSPTQDALAKLHPSVTLRPNKNVKLIAVRRDV
jgi:hypothetical protein